MRAAVQCRGAGRAEEAESAHLVVGVELLAGLVLEVRRVLSCALRGGHLQAGGREEGDGRPSATAQRAQDRSSSAVHSTEICTALATDRNRLTSIQPTRENILQKVDHDRFCFSEI